MQRVRVACTDKYLICYDVVVVTIIICVDSFYVRLAAHAKFGDVISTVKLLFLLYKTVFIVDVVLDF